MSNAQYVEALYQNLSLPADAQRQALVAGLDSLAETRASVLLKVVDGHACQQQERNPAFVLMQYFGHLRRNADEGPDSDMSGYNFWLAKLNRHGGDEVAAEMARSFLVSAEYRSRFG